MIDLNVPIYHALKAYIDSNPVPFHMPGHKLGCGLPDQFIEELVRMDLTEIPGTDNLHYPEGPIRQAQELAAVAFGAEHSFFLVNGSTSGIHAMIQTICKPGDKLIIGRDCHRSVIYGMMLAGVRPVYVKPQYNHTFGISTVMLPSDIERALQEHPDAVGVLLTRPTYYGVCSDLGKIASLVHAYGKVLAIDEAHGSHLRFTPQLPQAALMLGADICVQSAHKTLPAFTQGAYLHVKSHRIDIDKLKFSISLFQTTSPSYMIMASLDIARAIMERNGEQLLEGLLQNIERVKENLKGTGIGLLSNSDIKGGDLDKTRMVLNFNQYDQSGFEVDNILRKEYNIQVEMSDLRNIVCITTVADQQEYFERFVHALCKIPFTLKDNPILADILDNERSIPEQSMTLKEVMLSRGKKINLIEAQGEVCKETITPYPPGIPILCPGEIITQETLQYLLKIAHAGGIVNGISDKGEIIVVD